MRGNPLVLALGLTAVVGCAVEPAPPGTPLLVVTPAALDFGEVSSVDDPLSSQLVTLTNEGDADVVLGDVVVQGEAFTLPGVDRSGRSIAPGASLELNVQLAAERDGERQGQLRVPWNGDEALRVPLVADVLAPRVDVSPWDHDFGNPVVGCAPRLVVTIANVGREILVLHSVELDGNDEWALESTLLGDEIVEPSASASVTVRYQPDDPESDRAELIVRSSAPDQAEVTAAFEGRSHFETEATETFAGGRRSYPLAYGAVWETIRVTIDGDRVFSGWWYDDAEGPTLVFSPDAVPAASATIRVVYIALVSC